MAEQRVANPLLGRYAELFVTNAEMHARQTRDGRYFLVRQPVTEELIRRHLRGELTIGLYATTPLGDQVKWVCLDSDIAGGLGQIARVARTLRERGIDSLLEHSRRGGHLWVFLREAPTIAAREFARQVVEEERLEVEVYPRTEEGLSLVRAPLGIHRKTNRRYPFLDPETLEPVSTTILGNLEYLTTVEQVGASKLAQELAQVLRRVEKPAVSTVWEAKRANELAVRRGEVATLKERLGDLRQFIGQFVQLDSQGRGHCPFHPPDRTPSFKVHETFWICFHEVKPNGRYLGGDAIAFWMRYRGIDFPTALSDLSRLFE
jgi:hypothetical protein